MSAELYRRTAPIPWSISPNALPHSCLFTIVDADGDHVTSVRAMSPFGPDQAAEARAIAEKIVESVNAEARRGG